MSNPTDERLDAALARALLPPPVPPRLQERVRAALARSDAALPGLQRQLERERREQLAILEAGYVRLRRRTLGTLIGAGFAAGAAAAVAMPWLERQVGMLAPLLLAGAGAAAGLALAARAWLQRIGYGAP